MENLSISFTTTLACDVCHQPQLSSGPASQGKKRSSHSYFAGPLTELEGRGKHLGLRHLRLQRSHVDGLPHLVAPTPCAHNLALTPVLDVKTPKTATVGMGRLRYLVAEFLVVVSVETFCR